MRYANSSATCRRSYRSTLTWKCAPISTLSVGRAACVVGGYVNARAWVVEHCGLRPMYRKLIRELSKGYRQRVALAQALIHDPQVVILDEPTSGLDPHQIQEIRQLIRQLARDKTVLLSTHILQEVEAVADRLVIINAGRIVGDGTLPELQQQTQRYARALFAVAGTACGSRSRPQRAAWSAAPTLYRRHGESDTFRTAGGARRAYIARAWGAGPGQRLASG